MLYGYAATALLSAGLAFGAGWQVNQWRFDSAQKQAIEDAATAQRKLHALEQARSRAALSAQNVARTREAALRRDADRARDALDGLRAQSAAALHHARASHDACTATANAQAVVLTECAAELTTLAKHADAHASDAQLIFDSWPK